MERKNYLLQELSKEEKSYLKNIVLSARNTYLRKNWDHINKTLELKSELIDTSNDVLEVLLDNYEREMKNISEFENLFSNAIVYRTIKALSLKEKMVLFLLYKENKSVSQVSHEMKIRRETVWRIRNKVQDRILQNLLQGGKYDV